MSPDLISRLQDPASLDFISMISAPLQRAQQANAPSAQLWVGETAAAWHSGEKGVCNAFVSGFWYINQLGMLASTGHKVMCRQAFVGGNYALLDQLNNFIPNPDFWTGLLYHRLMGSKYVDIPQQEPVSADLIPEFKAYASCHPDKKGALTVAFSNLFTNNSMELDFNIDRLAGGDSTLGSQCEAYVLTSDSLTSSQIQLNGQVLHMVTETTLPSLKGVIQASGSIPLPPLSYGYLVFPDANASACL